MIKKFIAVISLFVFSSVAMANTGACRQIKNSFSGYFTVQNNTDETVQLTISYANRSKPSTSNLGSNGSSKYTNASIISVCAYHNVSYGNNVTKLTKIACCQNQSGFMGSQLVFAKTDSLVGNANAPAAASAGQGGTGYGALMGY